MKLPKPTLSGEKDYKAPSNNTDLLSNYILALGYPTALPKTLFAGGKITIATIGAIATYYWVGSTLYKAIIRRK